VYNEDPQLRAEVSNYVTQGILIEDWKTRSRLYYTLLNDPDSELRRRVGLELIRLDTRNERDLVDYDGNASFLGSFKIRADYKSNVASEIE